MLFGAYMPLKEIFSMPFTEHFGDPTSSIITVTKVSFDLNKC